MMYSMEAKAPFTGGVVVHGQPDAGQDLVDQHQHGQGAEEVPEVEVFRRGILTYMLVVGRRHRNALVDPGYEFTQHG
jgi:hypothetical protein